MKLKRLSEVSLINQPSDGANVIIEDGGSLGKTTLSGGDDQKWHETSTTQLFSETVTTSTGQFGNEAELAYSSLIDVDTLIVTFNGTKYVCPRINLNGMIAYGGIGANGPDFSEYPFAIARLGVKNMVFVENPGSYTVSASAENTTYTDAFKNGVIANASMVVNFTGSGEGTYTADKTNDDIINAFYKGTLIVGFVLGQSVYDGIPFNIERVNTLGPTPEISFNAVVAKDNGDIYLYRIVSYSDETGDGYELMELLLKQAS